MAEGGSLNVDQDGPVMRVRLDFGRTNALDRTAVGALADVAAEAEATASTQVLLLTPRRRPPPRRRSCS
jgi:enoyl-CoA hydratase/carnithine racemase